MTKRNAASTFDGEDPVSFILGEGLQRVQVLIAERPAPEQGVGELLTIAHDTLRAVAGPQFSRISTAPETKRK